VSKCEKSRFRNPAQNNYKSLNQKKGITIGKKTLFKFVHQKWSKIQNYCHKNAINILQSVLTIIIWLSYAPKLFWAGLKTLPSCAF